MKSSGTAVVPTGWLARHGSPLELLHPDGAAPRCAMLGGNAPTGPAPCAGRAAQADLVVLAPTARECRARGWLRDATRSLAGALAPDGVAYVLAPPGWRLRAAHLLRRQGLGIGPAVLHTPRYLVPLGSRPARLAFANLIPMPPRVRRFATLALRLPGWERLGVLALPSVGLVARRPGGRPLFDWVFRLDDGAEHPRSVIVVRGWRGPRDSVLLHRLEGPDGRRSGIAKLARLTRNAPRSPDEAAILTQLGPDARAAGAAVPRVLASGRVGARRVHLQSTVAGRTVAGLLRSGPDRVPEIAGRVAVWLEAWNRRTRTVRPLDPERLERDLLVPARLLAPLLPGGDAYPAWLAARCAVARSVPVPHVTCHNDLTMYNLLLDDTGALGVVDWETAREDGYPLVDFLYAVTDAAAAADGYRNRARAWERCFLPGGEHAELVGRLHSGLRSVIGIPDGVAELCVHACWLHHAANEHRAGAERRPFLQIVQRLAARALDGRRAEHVA